MKVSEISGKIQPLILLRLVACCPSYGPSLKRVFDMGLENIYLTAKSLKIPPFRFGRSWKRGRRNYEVLMSFAGLQLWSEIVTFEQ